MPWNPSPGGMRFEESPQYMGVKDMFRKEVNEVKSIQKPALQSTDDFQVWTRDYRSDCS